MRDNTGLFAEWELKIRAGEGRKIGARLERLARTRLDRKDAVKVANFAWRAGLASIGARLLSRYVHPKSRSPTQATPEEVLEYAACLVRLGMPSEAVTWIGSVDPIQNPKANLYLALAYVGQWNYHASIDPLRRYLASKGLSHYDKLVAQANLAAALVYEKKHVPAASQLRELIHSASLGRYNLLQGKGLELFAIDCFERGAWKEAETYLARAEKILAEAPGLDPFFIEKWRGLVAYRRAPKSEEGRTALNTLRKRADVLGQWETLRDCDREEAIQTKDEKLFTKVFLGTPYSSFRSQLEKESGGRKPAETLSLGSRRAKWHLDLGTGNVEGKPKASLRAGSLLHRVLGALLRDLYRPTRLSALHDSFFPGERYNPLSSPLRLRQAVRRFRRWAHRHRLPLLLKETHGLYRLEVQRGLAIRLSAQGTKHREALLLERLAQALGGKPFSVRDVTTTLTVPLRSAQRLLGEAVAREKIERVGSGPATRYRFP